MYACTQPKSKDNYHDDAFGKFTAQMVNDFLKLNPSWAMSIGLHDNDDILEIVTPKVREQKMAQYALWKDSLQQYPDSTLSPANRMDKVMLINYFDSYKWYSEVLKSHEWNPAEYNVGESFDIVLNNTAKSVNERLEIILKRLKQVPAYYENAISSIHKPTREHIQLAILQNDGSKYIFQKLIIDSLNNATISQAVKEDINLQLKHAIIAIDGYIEYLKKLSAQSSTDAFRDFRIGKELFEQKFKYDIQSSYKAEEIYHIALQRKAEIQKQMRALTHQLWPKYFTNTPEPNDSLKSVAMMIEALSRSHCHRDSFLQTIQKQIPELEKFINDKNLIYLDRSKPLVVRQTPPYMEGGGAGASINDPGPFNKNGKTYYNVSLLTHYTPQQAESYLREYNDYILQILNIHEAIPGHYTQLVYANQSPSLVKSIFGNGAMIEGWAVYGERMMLEEGYGNQSPELWLMYYKWHLRSVMNTILDYSIQCLNMTEEEAKRLMTQEAFQQQAEADGKWKRATLTQVQLCSYFTGFTEIYALREKLKMRQGTNFNLKKYHEQFLSYGSAPIPLISNVML